LHDHAPPWPLSQRRQRYVLLSLRERSAALGNLKLVSSRIYAKQDVALLERLVVLDWHLDHAAFDIRDDRCGREIDTGIGREGVIVVHNQQNCGNKEYSTKRSRRERPLVCWDTKDFEHCYTQRGVGEDEQ
jgi:hypothetical protein